MPRMYHYVIRCYVPNRETFVYGAYATFEDTFVYGAYATFEDAYDRVLDLDGFRIIWIKIDKEQYVHGPNYETITLSVETVYFKKHSTTSETHNWMTEGF